MAKISPNSPCPCGRSAKYKKCCRPLHLGRPPSSAEALMRSRYAAYALGLVDYIMRTTHPDSPHRQHDAAQWVADLKQFCDQTTFVQLEVLAHDETEHRATVQFRAHLKQGGASTTMVENSCFFPVEGRWTYHSALPEH